MIGSPEPLTPQTRALLEATKEVAVSREVLAFTYIEGYFLSQANAPELELFNYLQTSLESHTDHLQVRLVCQLTAHCGMRVPGLD